MKKRNLFLYLLVCLTTFSCNKDYLDTQPSDQIAEIDAFSSIANARAALNGTYRALYMQYSTQSEDGLAAVMINMDFMGEDVVHAAAGSSYFRGAHRWIDHRSVSSDLNYFTFRFPYKIIANANMLLTNIDAIAGDAGEKKIMKGEAQALRAWGHFLLVQLFGKRYDATAIPNNQPGIALLLQPSQDAKPRNTVEDVYKQINIDLDSAIANLTAPAVSTNKTHFNVSSAKGLKARVALTQQNWAVAATLAAQARASYAFMSSAQYYEGFSNLTNPEWMWGANQLANQLPAYGSFYAYMSANFNSLHTRTNPKLINSKLFTAMTATDLRKKLWWDGTTADAVNFPGVITAATGQPDPTQVKRRYQQRKYLVKDPSNSSGDIPFMRSAEMWLIEAEARARNSENAAAQEALFQLMKSRDASYVKSTKTGAALIEDIMLHRRIELWGEGFRFLDLKRTNSPLDRSGTGATTTLATVAVTTPIPAGDVRWQFLIPRREIEANPTIEQNP